MSDRTLSTIERLERAADSGTGITFVGASMTGGGEPISLGWNQLHDDARAVGAALQARGIVPGDHVAILGPTSRDLMTIVRGCWLAGAASMVLPLPMRMGSLDVFIESTRSRIRHGDAALVLIDDQLADFYVAAEDDPPIEPMKAVMPGSPNVPSGDALEIPPNDPDRLVILQYTSGSTSEPKGVMIPDRVLSANIDACAEAAELTPDSATVSGDRSRSDIRFNARVASTHEKLGPAVAVARWSDSHCIQLPGCARKSCGAACTSSTPFVIGNARKPTRPMSWYSGSHDTMTSLSGAEPVDPGAVEAFVAEASRFGFTAGGIFPAFGMAEVAIGGTFPPRGRGLVTDTVDRIVLETQRVAKPVEISDPDELGITARRLPLLGTTVPGLEMRVVDPETHEELPERHVGELLLRGTSVTPGYYKRPDATAALFRDGWLCTGDLAYLLDGELVLCGRIKDVIIVGGRNVFPEDIERAVGPLDGVRAGNVIAFGMEGYKGKESVVVVAEVRVSDDSGDLDAIRDRIHHRTLEVCGLPPRDVMLVTPGTLPKTSSGKLQRAKCRDDYLNELLELVP